jgi:uncharacterized delta-60 repeat protein
MRKIACISILLVVGCSTDPDGVPQDGALATDAADSSVPTDSSFDSTVPIDVEEETSMDDATDVAADSVVGGAAGAADTSFGLGGVSCFVITAGSDASKVTLGTTPTAIIQQPGGDVVLVGYGQGVLRVRFHPDGSIDTAATKGGLVVPAAPGSADDIAMSAVLASDGGFYVAGLHQFASDGGKVVQPLIARFHADLSEDSSAFGGKSYLLPDYGGANGSIRGVALVAGKLVVAGSMVDSSGLARAFVARHALDGALDTTFGVAGIRTFSFADATNSYVTTMIVAADGKIVVAGTMGDGKTTGEVALARLTAAGALDATFGTGGVVHQPIAGTIGATSIAQQSTGSFLVTASTAQAVAGGYAVARFGATGALDSTFGTAGIIAAKPDLYSARAVLTLPDDRFLVGAEDILPVDGGTTAAFSVQRFAVDGADDLGFGIDGRTTTKFSTGPDVPYVIALARQPDGRILAAGKARDGMCLARYLP